ncbi:InlB B-repeat-containing protein, partial [Candidatus Saccharibacteria bacterium]|nr:InlB B-repeat-containing protein [Candidatus Saccharibacteria bacterium]
SGYAYNFYLATGGALTNNGRIDTAYGIRPVISLKHGATIGGGDGTATSPWTLGKYTISYNANGGSGTMSNQTVYSGFEISLSANSFTAPSGKILVGWNTSAEGSGVAYDPGQTVTDLTTSGSSITLYAQWGDPTLYDLVATMSKGTQTAADLQAVITKPTSSNPTTDTSNSGVYEYNSSVFGADSDGTLKDKSKAKIYYYRGILDSNLDDTSNSSYGSNGDGAYYPNYVKLGNTCWRIVRTTGSGGVKMIYNGLYSSGTTANSCANAQDNAQITTIAFGSQGASAQSTWYYNISRIGYTYNATVDDSTTTTSVDTVFGSNSNYTTTNTTDSNIKDYLENTWFTSSNGISAYESILEPSAGYCNDRTAFSNQAGSTALTTIPPYATSSATMYFGSYSRNMYAGGKPSLTCPSSRNIVDLYTTASATNGNKQLAKPIALLTADEAALSGSGYSGRTTTTTYSSNYSYSSFLRSGSSFWLLSPYGRYPSGATSGSVLTLSGYLYYDLVYIPYGVRPAISLKYGTTPVSGTGIATDPWVIAP